MKFCAQNRQRHSISQPGFTLIEVMVVVAVIGVLTAIAYPSYQSYILRTNRSAAQQFILQIASKQEQYRLDARSYANTLALLNLTQPNETSARYTFSIADSVGGTTPPNMTAYTITATATGAQLKDKVCTLMLDNLGSKTYTSPATPDCATISTPTAGWLER